MTQHVYFNFKGESGGTIEDHIMTIRASHTAPTDAGQIPTGELVKVDGGAFDFRGGMRIGERINEPDAQLEIGKGYDHCWFLDRQGDGLEYAGGVFCPLNGRNVDVYTTEPCVQVYTANWASYDQVAKGGEHLSFRCGVALETQHAPDSPNKPQFPSTIVKANEVYRSTTEFRFGVK
jgi:aldose 1-epimerase